MRRAGSPDRRQARGRHRTTHLFIPLRGVSAIDVDDGPFRDEQADEALFEQLRQGLASSPVQVHELDQAINDPGFGAAMARALHEAIIAGTQTKE